MSIEDFSSAAKSTRRRPSWGELRRCAASRSAWQLADASDPILAGYERTITGIEIGCDENHSQSSGFTSVIESGFRLPMSDVDGRPHRRRDAADAGAGGRRASGGR